MSKHAMGKIKEDSQRGHTSYYIFYEMQSIGIQSYEKFPFFLMNQRNIGKNP